MLLRLSTYVIVATLLQLEQLLREKSRVQAAPVKGPRWWAPLSRCCGYIWFSFSCCGSLLLSMVSGAQRHLARVCGHPLTPYCHSRHLQTIRLQPLSQVWDRPLASS